MNLGKWQESSECETDKGHKDKFKKSLRVNQAVCPTNIQPQEGGIKNPNTKQGSKLQLQLSNWKQSLWYKKNKNHVLKHLFLNLKGKCHEIKESYGACSNSQAVRYQHFLLSFAFPDAQVIPCSVWQIHSRGWMNPSDVISERSSCHRLGEKMNQHYVQGRTWQVGAPPNFYIPSCCLTSSLLCWTGWG